MSIKSKILTLIRDIVPYGIVKYRRKKKKEKKLKYLKMTEGPDYFTNTGEKCINLYLQDDLLGWQYFSYTRSRLPDRIIWNRQNPTLKDHVYAHNEIKNLIGNPEHRYALLIETKEICPEPYDILLNNEQLAKKFDLIFTHSDALLEKYQNARFVPAGGVWYGQTTYGGIVSNKLYLGKDKNISLVCSDKVMCELHRIRLELAMKYKNTKEVDTFGTFDGGKYVQISETLQEYRFSIVIENTLSKYCFTEKILNCFEAMTIPIYLGAQCIGQFFNEEGIITITIEDAKNGLESIIDKCTEEYYLNHIEAVKDNFNRVQEYTCQEDYLTNHYLKEITGNCKSKEE